MSSSQRSPRRRSARLAFDEDNAPPLKKAKLQDTAEDGAADSRAARSRIQNDTSGSSAAAKKSKAGYEEDADGFQFSRATRTKRAPPKRKSSAKTQPHPNADATADAATEQSSTEQHGGKRRRSKELSTPNGTSAPKRRSARLSGERPENEQPVKESAAQVDTEQTSNEQPRSDDRRGRAQTPLQNHSDQLHVQKKRSPTKIALPFADTPVILRNKEMRKSSAEGRRRSSSQMRGRRASSLIASGASNAVPHSEVEAAEFYKHINQDMPEPRRMKQLLVWCGNRALPERPSGSTEDVNASLAARVIQEELLKDFSNKSEMSNWFDRDDTVPTAVIKKPNPRNIQNYAKLQELESEVKRLREEKASWQQLLGSLSSSVEEQKEATKAMVDAAPSASVASVDTSHLSEEERAAVSELLSQPTISSPATRVRAATDSLEFKIDRIAQGAHKVEQYREVAEGTIRKVLSTAAEVLDARDQAATQSAGTDKVGTRELLKGLGRAS